VGIKYCRTT